MTLVIEESNDFRWYVLRSKIHEQNIKKAFEVFRENEIEPILIKGWAAAQNYPQPRERIYADIDLCVSPAQFKNATIISEYEAVKKLNIDLHKGLRFFDTVAWEDLFANTQLIKIDQTEIRVLRSEDHLRTLCVHWLYDGGAYKEKLWDIYYAVENRGENFDWSRCLDVVSKRRKKWIVYTLGLTAKYLGLDLTGTPIESESKQLPKWLIKAVEKEWRSEVKLKPLQRCLDDKNELLRQIWKRMPPNPIQATIELEGSFDSKSRIFYQLGAIFVRIPPSFGRIKSVLLNNKSAENQ